MFSPKSVPGLTQIEVATTIGQAGTFIRVTVAGAVVYLDAKQTAALLAALCEAELAVFVKVR